jgi:serine protease Do
VVIGNPLGLGHTCSTGIVSSLHRTVQLTSGNRILRDLVQIDAAVNPGNSGGPVLNIRGELIGITSALPMDTKAQGIGFAIPIDRARQVVEDLIKYRYLPTGWLGLSVEDMAEAELEYGLSGGKGVFVSRVEDKSPAYEHFKAGDVIAAWDGATVKGLSDFVTRARALRPGQKVVLGRVRDGKSKNVELLSAAFPEDLADDWAWFHLGVRVAEGRVQARTRDGRIVERTGVFIEGIAGNSPAQAGGLTVSDLILKLNREEIGGRGDFRRAVAQVRARENAFIIFQRSGYPLPLWVTIPFRMSGERW